MPNYAELIFGRIAIANRLATPDQVARAIAEQESLAAQGTDQPLGAILRAQGVLTAEQVTTLLKAQIPRDQAQGDYLYGHLALKNGFLTQEQLDEALARQQKSFSEQMAWIRLGQILRDLGYVTGQQNESVIKAQIRLQQALQKKHATGGS